jgi:site-specific recombinase XerD
VSINNPVAGDLLDLHCGFTHIWPNEAGRHSGLSNMLRRYPDVRLAQYVAGHADIRTTQRYVHHELRDQVKVRRG